MIGRRLGPYRVQALLGKGGMGAVYRADGPGRNTTVALKVLSGAAALDESSVDRFRQEAAVLRGLQHPNIVAALGELASDGEHVYYAMELVEGPTLATVLKQLGKLPPAHAVAVILPVLSALAAAHAQGIVHRDVKPQNVLIAPGGLVKLVDFGLARALDATRLTMSGQIVGTPAYLSPEQAEGRPADLRSDLYAVGITLYECLAGRPPFNAETPIALLRMHLDVQPPKIELDSLPEGLEAAVRRALEKRPEARYSTAAAFGDAIRIPAIFSSKDGPDGRNLVAGLLATQETAEIPTPPPMPKVEAVTRPKGDGKRVHERLDELDEVGPASVPRPKNRWVIWVIVGLCVFLPLVCSTLVFLVRAVGSAPSPKYQFEIPMATGPRVRLHYKNGKAGEVGRLEEADEETVKLRLDDGSELQVQLKDLDRIEHLGE